MVHQAPTRKYGRRVAGLAAAALGATLVTLPTAAPAQAATGSPSPAQDCATVFPQGEVRPDDAVHGLSVDRGTAPTAFTGTVLGTLEDGIAPGLDMILMDLHSPAIERAGGIWEGMSGSPVYAEDGRLIGAVSYGLAYGGSTIAGVTPYAAMRKYLPARSVATARAPLDQPRLARRVARAAGVPLPRAAQGLTPIPTPLTVSGVSGRRMSAAAQRAGRFLHQGVNAARAGSGQGAGPGAGTIVAGGNLAAAVSHGQIALAGIGTVTSVCGGRVVGFGHPMIGDGASSMTMMTADSLVIQPDPLGVPFKVANLGAPVGTIDQDRLPGISGPLGPRPRTTKVTSTSTYQGRRGTGSSFVSVKAYNPDVTYYQIGVGGDSVMEALQPGGALTSYRVRGTGPGGSPFSLSFTNRYVDGWDISSAAAYPATELVAGLGRIPKVRVSEVRATTSYGDARRTRTVAGIQQKRRGHWQKVTARRPVVIRGKSWLRVRVVLTAADGSTRYRTHKQWIPRRYSRGTGTITVTGGSRVSTNLFGLRDLATAKERVSHLTRNDQVRITTVVRRAGTGTLRRSVDLSPVDRVVRGSSSSPVTVR